MLDKLEKTIIEKIDLLKDDLISLTKDLVSIPTVNPPGENYEECIKFLNEKLKEFGAKTEVVEVPSEKLQELAPHGKGLPRQSIISRIPFNEESEGIHLHFNGHYDVVPATGEWKTNPFDPVIKNWKIYGRGTSDMKGGIAAMIIAAKALLNSNLDLNGMLSLSFTPDEETDGFAGAGFITKEGFIKADYCIVGEPSGCLNIWNAHKGALWLELTTFGKSAHGSTPWLGINAFEKMVKIVNVIDKELKPLLKNKVSKFPTIPPEGNTATVMLGGIIKGGAAINIVPDRFTISIDRRFIPEESIDEVKAEIFNLLNKLRLQDPDLKFEVSIKAETNSCLTPLNSPICRVTSQAIKDLIGKEPSITMCIGAMDMRYFSNIGIPTIAYGPGSINVAHSENEYVSIEDLIMASKIYALTAVRILKNKGFKAKP
ncbi:MAG: M20 family metallopeptidase [Candidatus Bathyarchaeia archaeon]